jgi:hypothetical protein
MAPTMMAPIINSFMARASRRGEGGGPSLPVGQCCAAHCLADQLLAQMLSDLAIVRPAAPCLESTATQHDDDPGGDGEKQDIFQTNATHWHGQPSPCGTMRFVDYDEDDGKEGTLLSRAARGSVFRTARAGEGLPVERWPPRSRASTRLPRGGAISTGTLRRRPGRFSGRILGHRAVLAFGALASPGPSTGSGGSGRFTVRLFTVGVN